MIDVVLEMHWSNNPIPLDQLIECPDYIFDIPLGLFTSLEPQVKSVNGKDGDVVLNAADVGADAAGSAEAVQQNLNEVSERVDLIQPQLTSLSDNKLDKIDYVQHFRGLFGSYISLITALPIAIDGDYAHIKTIDFGRLEAIWNSDTNTWDITGANIANNTDELPEGSLNLYFKSERVRQVPMSGLQIGNDTQVLETDQLIQAIEKLQAQNNALKINWVNANMLTSFTWHPAIDVSKSKIEFAKNQGNILIKGYLWMGGNIGSNITLFTHKDERFMCDISFVQSTVVGATLAQIFMMTNNLPRVAYANQGPDIFAGGNQFSLVGSSLSQNIVYHIAQVAVGKAKILS